MKDHLAAERAVSLAVQHFGSIDVLVNNAGYGTIGSLEDTSIEEFRAQIETNVFGTVYTTRAAIPFMRKQGNGHIMQISSVGDELEHLAGRHIPPRSGASRDCRRRWQEKYRRCESR